MVAPVGTWKVTLPHAAGDDEMRAVVWREDRAGCEAWVRGRHALEPRESVMDYDIDGPFPPVPLPVCVVDRIRPAGPGRIVERFSAVEEAVGWVRNQARWERAVPYRGDYAVVDVEGLPEALRAPPTVIAPGGAVVLDFNRPGSVLGTSVRESLAPFEAFAVTRVVETRHGPVEARQYQDGHLCVTAGDLVDAGTRVAPVSMTWDGALSNRNGRGRIERRAEVSFEAVGSVDGDRFVPVSLACEIRSPEGWPMRSGDVFEEIRREILLVASDAATEMARLHPNDRLEALDRHYDGRLDALARRRGELVDEIRRLDEVTRKVLGRKSEIPALLMDVPEPEAGSGYGR